MIKVKDLTFSYNRQRSARFANYSHAKEKQILHGLNFTVEDGEIFGFLGPNGSGKSTTLASIVDFINQDRHDHIITLEDPIEYLIPSKNCHVNQREVHKHTESFARALRGALREDPDVIMVGEMRDLETISLALTAAETGHLVLGTLHTGSAARTVDRVLDVFPVEQRDQIRIMVSESLRGII